VEVWVDGSPKRIGYMIENSVPVVINLTEDVTHNEAEYRAVIAALEAVPTDVLIILYSDSQLVVNQLNKTWAIKEEHLRKLAQHIWKIIAEKRLIVRFKWIKRQENPVGKVLG